MEEQLGNTGSSQFLKKKEVKSESNAMEVPSIALPKGGGAIKGIDEKFSVNAVNGTATFSIPLPLSQSRGVSPSLALSYNSGAGNSAFGLGWDLDIPSIKRKTDKGLPQYLDAIDSDTFLFSETDDLIPEFRKRGDGSFETDSHGDYVIKERPSSDGSYVIRNYIPRIEGMFARVERWSAKANGRIRWRVINRENTTTLFGWTDNAVISNPKDPTRIYKWLPEFVFDDRGNCSQYIYRKEDKTGVDYTLLHNKNRYKNGKITYSNSYLEKVFYGNQTPYHFTNDHFPVESDYLFSMVLDYGTLLPDQSPEILNSWDYRHDAFSFYKAGFEIRTTRLCKRILLFHHFRNEHEYDGLVKSLNFRYNSDVESPFSFLEKISSIGYIKKPDGTYYSKELPPIGFEYQQHQWNGQVKSIPAENTTHSYASRLERKYQFTDLYSEGLSGILTEQGNSWYYKRNLGNCKFEPAKLVSPMPSLAGVGSTIRLVDLEGDGRKQLVSFKNPAAGYFELNDENQWLGMRSFKSIPNIDLSKANIRMLDLNGDGKPEMVISEDHAISWYPSEGKNGFVAARKTAKPIDEEEGPRVVFTDTDQTIHFADMSGDGMVDIVRVRNGEVCYWPNLGYGKFGSKVALDHAPVFDHPDCFNPSHIRLADIDGSGTTDIVYLGKNTFTCWKNLSGNRFGTTPFEIKSLPDIHSKSNLTVTDLLGNGVACIVWFSSLSKDSHAPLKYMDLMNGKKPYILSKFTNNMGKEVSMEYTSSTKFYLDDELAGQRWVTKLHFPIQCVSKTTTEDKVSGHKFISKYKYHHGYYDHAEKEFRGFGLVEQIDAESFEHWVKEDASNIVEESLHQEPVVTKTWHHTGAFLQNDKILSQFAKDHWYKELQQQGFTAAHHEVALPDACLVVAPGIDPSVLNQLSVQEWQEAQRACKGLELRSEVLAKDAGKHGNTGEARKRELIPFSVTTQNYIIELLQPKGKNKHAVFTVKESEALTYAYERHPEDPRVTHNLNIKTDEYGNVLESAAVVYPRLATDSSLPAETQQAQSKTVIIYKERKFTNDVIEDDISRLRQVSEEKTFELSGVFKTNTYYKLSDFTGILAESKSGAALYHQINKPLVTGKVQKRLIEHLLSTYYRNDLTGVLPLHQLESLALPFEKNQLAFTAELLADTFGAKVDASLMTEGKFIHGEVDNNWWNRSGTTQYKLASENQSDAEHRFYSPISYTDPYGAITRVTYYGNYYLFIEETENALGNTSGVVSFNFRTLSPGKVRDINGNYSEVICDELGFVKALAVMGKGNEADELTGLSECTDASEILAMRGFFQAPDAKQLTDIGKNLLNRASLRYVYDLEPFTTSGKPVVAATITREQHFKELVDSPFQIGFEYSNGMGEVIMKKGQAEPGPAKQVNTAKVVPQQLRWIGSGRIIKNNKGSAVKQYQPYFSVTHQYEDCKELVETGVTPILYYDAVGRLIKTEMPDGSYSKVEFDSWKQLRFDANDTILESYWYHHRTHCQIDTQLLQAGKDPIREKIAADSAALHANTPNVVHLDTLGRPVLSVDHNKNSVTEADEFYHTKIELDCEGNLRTITDARGNTVMQYKYDMLGNLVYQKNSDSGQRWTLYDIQNGPLRTWDERDHEFQYFYDIIHRPVHSKVINTVGNSGDCLLDNIFDRVVYGESLLTGNRSNEAQLQARNVLGQTIQHYDTGGLAETTQFDIRGQPTATNRRLFKKYKETVNWIGSNLLNDLEPGAGFTTTTKTDALGRTTQQITPDGSTVTFYYNRTGLLNRQDVLHPGSNAAATYIVSIDYNELGQRSKVIYGNNVSTKYYYDQETFKLKRLESKHLNGGLLQDWHYTYDPVGNITHIEDKSIHQVFYNNQKISGLSAYTYDALYRLVEATGKENDAAISFGTDDNWNDEPFKHFINPGDRMAVRNYARHYQYDHVGNITQMKHTASGGNWTRTYQYETVNNRLRNTQIGNCRNPSRYTKYKYHEKHGFMVELPHLEHISWNFKDQVVSTSRQRCTDGNIPVITYYQYDGNGQRLRKITENQAPSGARPGKKEERIYIGGYELYKKHSNPHGGLERTSLSLMDEGHRFATIETRNSINDGTEAQLIRYQLHNHLGSCTLELDGSPDARIISYEEYHPYGTTAYQAKNRAIKSAAKRYRYTGMERDEETGLEYHSARYYLPWLGRWLSCDPLLSGLPQGNSSKAPQRKGKIRDPQDDTGIDRVTPDIKRPQERQNENVESTGSALQNHEQQQKSPLNSGEELPSNQEELSGLKNLNPYAYGASNPIIYKDPTGNVPIIQEWWKGYEGTSTDEGKVGYGFLFIFAWLLHVIINLIVLVLSITILNPAGLLGAWDFSYGGIQSILGLALGVFTILLGADVRPHLGMGAEVEMPAYMKFYVGYGVSLGPVTFGGHGFSHWDHEAGHTWQSRVLGPLYLFIIGIPSAAGAQYTEDWADDWAT